MIPRTLFSPDHDAFRDTVRRFIAEHVSPHHADWEKAGQYTTSLTCTQQRNLTVNLTTTIELSPDSSVSVFLICSVVHTHCLLTQRRDRSHSDMM